MLSKFLWPEGKIYVHWKLFICIFEGKQYYNYIRRLSFFLLNYRCIGNYLFIYLRGNNTIIILGDWGFFLLNYTCIGNYLFIFEGKQYYNYIRGLRFFFLLNYTCIGKYLFIFEGKQYYNYIRGLSFFFC